MAEAIPHVITLNLTLAEARAMLAICARIGGNPEETRRGLADNVYNALIALIPDHDPTLCKDMQFPSNIDFTQL